MKHDIGRQSGILVDQDDIAVNCGVGRTHVPRALKPLINDNLIEVSLGRVPGRIRRVKIYSLTREGLEEAILVRDRALGEEVEWESDGGERKVENRGDALRKINDELGSVGMPHVPLSFS